jgi:hypothetical protein
MKKNTKERLFEVMGRLDKTFKPKLNEESPFNDAGEPMMTHQQYRDYSEPSEPDYDAEREDDRPQQSHGIGNFNDIDWHALYETLQINYENVTGKHPEYVAYDYRDLTDDEGMLTPEELQHLEDWGLVEKMGSFPVIGADYGDDKSFYNKAKEIWSKEPPQTHETGMVDDAPYLRGNEPMSESNIDDQDWDDNYTNEDLVVFLKKWFGPLKYYADEIKAPIIAKALEDEFPTLKINNESF